jgi:N12 class adenine-specific DNA methylase
METSEHITMDPNSIQNIQNEKVGVEIKDSEEEEKMGESELALWNKIGGLLKEYHLTAL